MRGAHTELWVRLRCPQASLPSGLGQEADSALSHGLWKTFKPVGLRQL